MQIRLVLPALSGVTGHACLAMAQSAGTITATGSMATPRAFHTATVLTNGMVLIAGGSTDINIPLGTAELYDPDRGTFTAAGNMTSPRMGHTATMLPDGKVLIAGGTVSVGQGFVPSNGAEIYDPSIGIFSATGKMIGNHGCQQAILLDNGKVLITGGSVAGAADRVRNAELYDPATGTFATTGPYVTDTHLYGFNTCQGSQSALHADGRGLIVFESGGAELYDPSRAVFTLTGNPIIASYSDGLPTATLLMNGNILAGTARAVTASDPAVAGEALELYGTGLKDGGVIPPQIAIGDSLAEMLYLGNAPGFAGLNQMNVRVPSGIAAGPAVPVRLNYIGRSSNYGHYRSELR